MDWKTKIFFAILILVVLYLLWQLTYFLYVRYKNHNELIEKYNQFISSKNEFEKTEKVLFSQIESIFGEEISEHLKAGTIWESMPIYLLKIALGEPQKIEKREQSSIWIYGPYKNDSHADYFLKVSIEKNSIKEWVKSDTDIQVFEKNKIDHLTASI